MPKRPGTLSNSSTHSPAGSSEKRCGVRCKSSIAAPIWAMETTQPTLEESSVTRKENRKADAQVENAAEGRSEMMPTTKSWTWLVVTAAMVAGCTSSPAATLSVQDPKWRSPQCEQIRAEALSYKERNLNWAAGMLIGPYGLAIVAAGKEHQEKQRKLLAREMHIRCSSLPLPKKLQVNPSTVSG